MNNKFPSIGDLIEYCVWEDKLLLVLSEDKRFDQDYGSNLIKYFFVLQMENGLVSSWGFESKQMVSKKAGSHSWKVL